MLGVESFPYLPILEGALYWDPPPILEGRSSNLTLLTSKIYSLSEVTFNLISTLYKTLGSEYEAQPWEKLVPVESKLLKLTTSVSFSVITFLPEISEWLKWTLDWVPFGNSTYQVNCFLVPNKIIK